MKYEDLNLKKPQESEGYSASSDQAVESIESIVDEAIKSGQNKIVINTNLKLGLPMENINKIAGLMDGIMEVVKYNAYDIKYLSDMDINYNPALGTGQIQIKDIHYIEVQKRTSWKFCQLLDKKYLASSKRSFESWLELANRYKWIK